MLDGTTGRHGSVPDPEQSGTAWLADNRNRDKMEPEAEATPADIVPLVYSVPEAAAILGISKDLAYELAACGQIPSLHFGRRVVVPRKALLALLEQDNGSGRAGRAGP